MRRIRTLQLLMSVLMCSFFLPASAAEMKLAVTTSFHNSGLSEVLLPEIKKDLDLEVRLVVVGTGQALRLGKAGDVDAVLVHSKQSEVNFVSNGFGLSRREIMYNDFVILGPMEDPAKISGADTAISALKAIHKARSIFVSRGDDSGTHRKEVSLWKNAIGDPADFDAGWYRASGSGMGATLNVAAGTDGYVLSDRATWLNFGNKRSLKILFSGDPVLFNQYGYLRLNPDRHSHVHHDLAKQLEDWLTSEKAQKLIGNYKIAGEALFTPNAKDN